MQRTQLAQVRLSGEDDGGGVHIAVSGAKHGVTSGLPRRHRRLLVDASAAALDCGSQSAHQLARVDDRALPRVDRCQPIVDVHALAELRRIEQLIAVLESCVRVVVIRVPQRRQLTATSGDK